VPDFHSADQQLDAWIDAHRTEIIESASGLIQIPSVKGEPVPGAPFGAETLRALKYVLMVAERYGLKTKMLAGYAAHAEIGGGDGLIGVLSHVDVVPAGNDWKHEPFGGAVEEGQIWGRGAIDDKGPTIAGLYSVIALKDCGLPISKRIRVIVGADEESGFGCMEHYFANEEMPDVGFTPDGNFPAIYAEKGIATPVLTRAYESDAPIKIERLEGGHRPNMVPDRAAALLSGDDVSWAPIITRLGALVGISTELEPDGNRLWVRAQGVSAHASAPEDGVNAVALLCEALLYVDHLKQHEPVLAVIKDWAKDTTGATLGIAGSDSVSGPLTSNMGIISWEKDTFTLTFSVRYPVTWQGADVKSRLEANAGRFGFVLAHWEDSPPLYVPMDDPFLQTLIEVYRAETGDQRPPECMGGGTYARVLKKGVAFGPNFPGCPDLAHQAEERWPVNDLIRATKIYARALARLAM
jgi:succinyl-diaminopimelate desuccinylase